MQLGKWNELTVARIKEIGAYLTDGETDVLLPKKQVGDLRPGDSVKAFIYKDSQGRLISTVREPYITVGEIKKLKVTSIANFGAFMYWGLERDIFLPFKEQTTKVKEGCEYLVRMYIDKSERLCVSMRLYNTLPLAKSEGVEYKVGDTVSGTVYEFKQDLGAFVAIEDKYAGFIHKSEIYSKLMPGDTLNFRVVNVDEEGKVYLSPRELKHIQINSDSELVYNVIMSFDGVLPFNESASPEVIKREFGLSKAAFKRAVGHLLKEGKIEITEKSIRAID